MTSGTRAARAASSRQTKQRLVQLLYGHKYGKQGPKAHSKLDHTIYSHTDLRKAYLARLQEIHPDKTKSEANADPNSSDEFKQLQAAWDSYEVFARVIKSANVDANFTKFGVGCSFADTAEESSMRMEIMDQACRGWFSAGELAESSVTSADVSATKKTESSLLDDDMFVEHDTTESSNKAKDERIRGKGSRPSLVKF